MRDKNSKFRKKSSLKNHKVVLKVVNLDLLLEKPRNRFEAGEREITFFKIN